jgi:hypothetical protein
MFEFHLSQITIKVQLQIVKYFHSLRMDLLLERDKEIEGLASLGHNLCRSG